MNNINLKDRLLDALTKYYENLLNTNTKFSTTIKEINDLLLDRALDDRNRITLVFNFDVFPKDGSSLIIYAGKYNINLPYISDLKTFNKVKTYYLKIENFNIEVNQKTNISFNNLIELTLQW